MVGIDPSNRRHLLKEALKGCRKIKQKVRPEHEEEKFEKNRFTYRSCERKRAYKSQGEATRFAHECDLKYGTGRSKVYFCDICGMWHITVIKPKTKLNKKDRKNGRKKSTGSED